MTATLDRASAELLESTPEDTRKAVRSALERADMSYDELEICARSGDFPSMVARMAWIAVCDLKRFAE